MKHRLFGVIIFYINYAKEYSKYLVDRKDNKKDIDNKKERHINQMSVVRAR